MKRHTLSIKVIVIPAQKDSTMKLVLRVSWKDVQVVSQVIFLMTLFVQNVHSNSKTATIAQINNVLHVKINTLFLIIMTAHSAATL